LGIVGDSDRGPLSGLLLASADLGLGSAAHLLHPVAALLALLARLLLLLEETVAGQTVLGLELLGEVQGVVDEGEARGAAATEVGAESEGEDHIGGDLVHGGQLLADLGLVHRRQSRVQDIADHLLSCNRRRQPPAARNKTMMASIRPDSLMLRCLTINVNADVLKLYVLLYF